MWPGSAAPATKLDAAGALVAERLEAAGAFATARLEAVGAFATTRLEAAGAFAVRLGAAGAFAATWLEAMAACVSLDTNWTWMRSARTMFPLIRLRTLCRTSPASTAPTDDTSRLAAAAGAAPKRSCVT